MKGRKGMMCLDGDIMEEPSDFVSLEGLNGDIELEKFGSIKDESTDETA